MEGIFILILYFAICAFFGFLIWTFLAGIHAVKKEKYFLYGPFSLLDGMGVLIIYFYNLLNIPLALKIISFFLILVVLEYSASLFLDKVLHLKLWNHKKYRFNLNGRVSLRVSLLWLALMLFVVFVWQDFLFGILHKLPINLAVLFSVLFLVYFAIDFSFSLAKYLRKIKK